MVRSKTDGNSGQAAFDFDTAAGRGAAITTTVTVAYSQASPAIRRTEAAPVFILADRRRERHLNVVRRLLAETGVFRAD